MLSKNLEDAFNEQVNKELYSAYLYLSMSAYCEAEGFPGFASWMRMQAQEEVGHAMRLFDHVNARGGRVVLKAIDMPPPVWKSPLEMFEQVLDHFFLELALDELPHRLLDFPLLLAQFKFHRSIAPFKKVKSCPSRNGRYWFRPGPNDAFYGWTPSRFRMAESIKY